MTMIYTRAAGYDKRISHGDDYAGDCWKDQDGIPKWVVVGSDPNDDVLANDDSACDGWAPSIEARALCDRLYDAMCDVTTMRERRLQRILDRAYDRVARRMAAQDASACGGFGCVDGCGDCAPTCPFCDGPAHAKQCQPQRLAFLLSAHAAAWWRNLRADDFVEQVNATFDAYLAGGGNDEHYDAHWRAMSDAAKEAR